MNLKRFEDKKYTKIALYAIITIVIIFTFCIILSLSGGFFRKLFKVIGLVLHPIISGGIIAYLFEPPIQRLEKMLHGSRTAAVIITVLVVLVIIIGGLVLIASVIQHQSNAITVDTGSLDFLFKSLDMQIDEITGKVQSWLSEHSEIIGKTFKEITGIFGSISDFASNLFFSVLSAIYFLLDYEHIGAYWSHILDIFVRTESRAKARELIRDADRCFSGYIRGKLLDALLVFIMVSISMLICRIPYPFAIGMMTAVGNLIPFVGPIGGIIALLVICLTEGLMDKFILGTVVLIILMQIDANVFNPRLTSKSISIHPLLVFSAMIAGGAVGGVVGMLVSAPIAAWLKIEFDKYIARKEAETVQSK